MKKFKKVFLIILLFVIALFACFRVKDYIILSKITKVTEGLQSMVDPYFIKVTDTDSDGTVLISEQYAKNNIGVSKTTNITNGEKIYESISWKSLDEEFINEYHTNYIKNSDGKEEKLMTSITRDKETLKEDIFSNIFVTYFAYTLNEVEIDYQEFWLELRNEIEDKLFYPVVLSGKYKDKECYVFYPYGRNACMKAYVDKESLLTIATESWNNVDDDFFTKEYEYLTDAPESLFEKPNPEDFEEVTFYDYANNNIDTKTKLVAEKAISGTELKPGEMLIENVEIKKEEDVNFLKLTPNESGIIKFEVYNLETYNKFREKYSNLRELTEEDFKAYYVTIAYAIDENLNYLNCLESKEAWKFNFVVNSEKENKNTLLLAVIPNESGNRQTIFVENDEKVNIDAEQAINISNENIEEIGKNLEIEFESYLGYMDDHLDLLRKEEFSDLEYIKTPIKGEEKICWNLHYRVSNHETINYIEVYIDAVTGELIGAKKFYK